MYAHTSHSGFPSGLLSGLLHGRRFDLVQISTIAVGVIVMTTLAMMF